MRLCLSGSKRERIFAYVSNQVEKIYKNLRLSKAHDIDGFEIQPFIYNLSLGTGIFPRQMKIAKCVAIHKGGSISDLSNYRQVLIVPVLSNGLENIIYIRMANLLSKHSVLSGCQFGFRKCISTESAEAFGAKHLAIGVYIDFSKAFDVISPTILLDSLFITASEALSLPLYGHTWNTVIKW